MNKKMALSSAVAAAALGLIFTSAPASAQASRTWVSGVGDDVNPCSRTAPCKTYAGAISKTAAGGEINCLDPGGFGALTITKSISVVCDYTEGGVLASLTSGFTVNMSVAGNIVTLKGQDVECFINGINGVRILGAGVTVHIHKSQFRNCRGGGSGINVANSSGVAEVHVDQVYISGNGNSTSQAGILIRPTGGASANVTVSRANIEDNTNGIFADGAGGGGASNVNVIRSVISGSSNSGVVVSSTGAAFTGLISGTLINFNANTGAAVNGASATLRIGDSTISNNGTGVSAGTGTLQSFKNNMIAANSVDGTPMTAFPGPGGQPLQ